MGETKHGRLYPILPLGTNVGVCGRGSIQAGAEDNYSLDLVELSIQEQTIPAKGIKQT